MNFKEVSNQDELPVEGGHVGEIVFVREGSLFLSWDGTDWVKASPSELSKLQTRLVLKSPVENRKSLPLTGNEVGDVRADELNGIFHKWDGTSWVQPTPSEVHSLLRKEVSGPLVKKKRVHDPEVLAQSSMTREYRLRVWDDKVLEVIQDALQNPNNFSEEDFVGSNGKVILDLDGNPYKKKVFKGVSSEDFESLLSAKGSRIWNNEFFKKELNRQMGTKRQTPGAMAALARYLNSIKNSPDGKVTEEGLERIFRVNSGRSKTEEAAKFLGKHTEEVKRVLNAFLKRKLP